MPVAVRRSSRSVPAKPVAKPATEPKAPAKPKSQPTKKRAASPARAESPAPKRSRTTAADNKKNEQPPPTKKPASKQPTKAAAKPATKPVTKPATVRKPVTKPSPAPEKRAAAPVPQQKPYFNPLPVAPPKQRPGLTLWAWGAGNFGQFGMGPDVLGELDKPRKNPWVEQKIQSGEFGEEGAGLETIAAGGMHTIFVDEKGTVSRGLAVHFYYAQQPLHCRFGHAGSMMMLHSVGSLRTFPTPRILALS